MDSNLQIALIGGIISLLTAILTVIGGKWMEGHQTKAAKNDETKGALALAKFSQEETIRLEMQKKIEMLERKQDRNERGFTLLRDSINDILRETLLTMQLAIIDIRNNDPEEAKKKLEEGIARIKAIKLPELPHWDEHQETKK